MNTKPNPKSALRTPPFLLGLLLLLAPAPAPADDVPAALNYQGKLTDNSGNPLTNGLYTINFRIWKNANSTNPTDFIWGREFPLYVGSNGVFNILLTDAGGLLSTPSTGQVSSIVYAFDEPDRYLGLSIKQVPGGALQTTAPEIMPRQRFALAPYAAHAQRAGLATGAYLASNAWSFATYNTNDFLMSTKPSQTLTGSLTVKGSLTVTNGPITVKSNLVVSGNAGIGVANPNYRLSFPNELGDKISLYGTSGGHFGFGIADNLLQVHADTEFSHIAFGYGQSTNFNETMRITGLHTVGIGTSNPQGRLDVNGTFKLAGNAPIVIITYPLPDIPASPADGSTTALTTYPTNLWSAVVVGWSLSADVAESNNGLYSVRAKKGAIGGANWYLEVYYHHQGSAVSSIQVDVMFINKNMVNDMR